MEKKNSWQNLDVQKSCLKLIFTISQACMFALWLEKDIQHIADTPRFHHQLSPNEIVYQSGFSLVRVS